MKEGREMQAVQPDNARLCVQGVLVALWLTNRPRLWRFVEDELLPAWQLLVGRVAVLKAERAVKSRWAKLSGRVRRVASWRCG